MRVLIISHTPFDDNGYKGGNWVNALVDTLAGENDLSVAVAYVSQLRKDRWTDGNVTYYPIFHKHTMGDRFRRIVLGKPSMVRDDRRVKGIIEDFKPDIVQLFGLETEHAGIVGNVRDVPVVVHLQGVISEYVKYMYPQGIDSKAFRRSYPLVDRILRRTYYDSARLTMARTEYEQFYFRKYKYYLGRTFWDRKVCTDYAPEAVYFVCDELLRKEFHGRKWSPRDGKVILTSVFNGESYKGYDTILKTSETLRKRGFEFEWNVFGITPDNPVPRIFEKQLGINFEDNNVHLKGSATAAELADALCSSTLFIHTSHIDNSPNSVCEAMLVGLPVIAMNVGGLSSIVEDGISGMLVDDYDIDGLAGRIMDSAQDYGLLLRISAGEIERAEKRHSKDNVIAELTAAWNSILKEEAL